MQAARRGAIRGARSGRAAASWLAPPPSAFRESPLHSGGGENDEKDDPPNRRRVTEVKEPEALVVEEERQYVGRADWTALRHHEYVVEYLEGIDHRHDQLQHGDPGQQRPRHVPELAPRARAVHARCLVVRRRNRLQTGEVDDHRETEPL